MIGDARSTFLAVVKGDASQAVTEFRRMGGAIQKETTGASGSVSRFSQLMTKAKTEITANAGLIAAGVTVAAVAVAAKFAFMAQSLALAAGKMSDSTGLTVESASRWIEVAGDIGIATDEIGGLVTKMTQNLGKSPEAFAKLGIETVKAKDGTVDMNATLLNAIKVISEVKDPTERAALGAKLFGKSWSTASELIASGVDNVKAKLASVDDAKVFSEQDVADARKMREQLDELKDAGEKLALAIGKGVVPILNELLPIITAIAESIGWVVEQVDKLDFMAPALDVETFTAAAAAAKDETYNWNDTMGVAARAEYELGVKAEGAAAQVANLRRDIEAAHTAFTQWSDALDADKSLVDLEIELRGAEEALKGLDPLEKESALLGFQQHIRDVTAGLEGIPEKTVMDIATQFDGTNYESIMARINTLLAIAAAGIYISVTTGAIVGTADAMERRLEEQKKKKGKASGGPASGLTLVGERGPEMVRLPGGSFVHNAPETARLMGASATGGGSSGGSVTNIYNVNVATMPGGEIEAGRRMNDALLAFSRSGGRLAA